MYGVHLYIGQSGMPGLLYGNCISSSMLYLYLLSSSTHTMKLDGKVVPFVFTTDHPVHEPLHRVVTGELHSGSPSQRGQDRLRTGNLDSTSTGVL
jgi:hypothetical protein